jgi:hypothetical protein
METVLGSLLFVSGLVALIAADTLLLRFAIPVFQGRANNFLTRAGWGPGLFQFVLVIATATALSVLLHSVIGVVVWWAAAIGLFGLTIRQTIKLNICFGLFHIALLVALGHLGDLPSD